MLLPIPIVCFAAALLADVGYADTALIPWLDFSNWLILAGLLAGAAAAILLLIDFVRSRRVRGSARARAHLLFFYAALLVELFNMFVHDRDGWTAVVPTGFTLSVIGLVLALIAGWLSRPKLVESTP
ncbi:MAG: DUF2231 domain-containing protein [Sphingomonadaceae bacterium]|nr:DUF2231 domain-containing protein [Sphingomonadaceae bacterium]